MTDSHPYHAPSISEMMKSGSVSVVYLRETASRGDFVASMALGYIYFRGVHGVGRDYAQSLYWFEKVKLEDDITGFAAWHIAIIYYRGLGVAKSYRMAARYLRSATLHGHSKSRVLFAILQRKGRGTLQKPRSSETMLRATVRDSRLSIMVRFWALTWLFP